jgi:hypothetical protein
MIKLIGHALRFGGVAVMILANLPQPYRRFDRHRVAVTMIGILVAIVGAYMAGDHLEYVG